MEPSFYLDNDVDIACARVIRSAGYRCWTAANAGRRDVGDDDQTVYATDKGAVLITHDREFTERRKKLPIGQHVRLVCHQLDGPDLLARCLPKLVTFLAASPDMTIEVSPGIGDVSQISAWYGSGENRPSAQE